MAITIRGLKALDKFQKSLSKDNFKDIDNRIANALADYGKELAQNIYQGTGITDVEITTTPAENGICQIIASKEGIAYIEFGTGIVGKESGYPQEKLLTETLNFESPKGYPQSTTGYEYNYPNPITKRDGKGWFYGGQYTQGQPAGFQLYTTAVFLNDDKIEVAKNVIKGGDIK